MSTAAATEQVDAAEAVTTLTNLLGAVEIPDSESYSFVDTPEKLSSVLDRFHALPTNPPSLYLDIEGENLGRDGNISIIQIFIAPRDEVYLIDVYTLKERTFTVRGEDGTTFKDVLESSSIPKVFFDVRNDSDALYSHYQVGLRRIRDLQLMEVASRRPGRKLFVNGLSRCVEKHVPLTFLEALAWKHAKKRGYQLFAPECGGSYAVFNQRPLSDEIKQYCTQDVTLLPQLWSYYDENMTSDWRDRVRVASEERVTKSQSPEYQPQGTGKRFAPVEWMCI